MEKSDGNDKRVNSDEGEQNHHHGDEKEEVHDDANADDDKICVNRKW